MLKTILLAGTIAISLAANAQAADPHDTVMLACVTQKASNGPIEPSTWTVEVRLSDAATVTIGEQSYPAKVGNTLISYEGADTISTIKGTIERYTGEWIFTATMPHSDGSLPYSWITTGHCAPAANKLF
jgi:hypothetical protein